MICKICNNEINVNSDDETIICGNCGAKITRVVHKTTYTSKEGIPEEVKELISKLKNSPNELNMTTTHTTSTIKNNLNMQKNKKEVFYSWPIILIALYVFFPLGIYLIIKKQQLHRKNTFTTHKKTFKAAIGLFIVAGIFYLPMIFSIFDNDKELKETANSGLGFGFFFTILGTVILLISFYQKNKAEKYRQYLSLIVNRDTENLDEIATKMNLDKSKVIKDIRILLDKKFLPCEYDLDIEDNRIYDVHKAKRKKEEREREIEKNTRVVKCPNCYANNKLTEKIGRCEYCNSYIE